MINLKNFRIKKVTDGEGIKYYPQEKWLGLFWRNMFTSEYRTGGYYDPELAQMELCSALRDRNPVVEYLEVECPCDE